VIHQPRRRFGQHFLHDAGAVERIVDAMAPRPGQHLVEIGPGQGVLTRRLIARAGRLDAIEIDRDLAAALQAEAGVGENLTLHAADALRFDFASLAAERGAPLRVVGNLPYNISTPLLFHLLGQRAHVVDMHFMLQREVVERMAAAADTPARGRLSVMIQAGCRVEPLFRLGPGAFRPPPKVDSSVVRLIPRTEPGVPAAHATAFAELVRLAFGGRRKTLRRSLAARLDAATISACGVDPGLRPACLTVEDFARLAAAASAQEPRARG